MRSFKNFLLFTALCLSQHLFSQSMSLGIDAPEFNYLRAGTLYVVPTGNAVFDDSLRLAVAKFWKISPSKAITSEEFEQYAADEKNCFIGVMLTDGSDEYNTDVFLEKKDPTTKGFHKLYIFHGGEVKKKKIKGPKVVLGSCPFYFFDNKYDMNCLGFLINQLNDCTARIIEKNINGPKIKAGTIVIKGWDPAFSEPYPMNPKVLKTKTLLVNSLLLSYPLPEKILALYKYPYKVVSAEEMISLMQSAPDKYCFLGDDDVIRGAILRIFDVQTQKIVYVGYGTGSAAKISDKQIEELNGAIGK